MPETFSRFDAADYLTTDEGVVAYLGDAAACGDSAEMLRALSTVVRVRGVEDGERSEGMTVEAAVGVLLDENAAFAAVVQVARLAGFDLVFRPRLPAA